MTRLLTLVAVAALAVAVLGSPAPDDASTDGITVHGAWTIDVAEADGTPVASHAFQNSLTPDGQIALSQLLTGGIVDTNRWIVSVEGAGPFGEESPSPCGDAQTPKAPCALAPPATGWTGTVFNTLETSVDGTDIVLVGTLTASQDGFIGRVHTFLETCPTSSCDGITGEYRNFTERTLHDPNSGELAQIPVSDGQVATVEVRISFS